MIYFVIQFKCEALLMQFKSNNEWVFSLCGKWVVVVDIPTSFHSAWTPLGGCGRIDRYLQSFFLPSFLFFVWLV